MVKQRFPMRSAGCTRVIGQTVSLLAILAGSWGLGCSQQEPDLEAYEPMAGPPIRVAIAPAMNFSGSSEFDPFQVADLMASETTSFEKVSVIGVNRVLAVLREQGVEQIQSPQHALDVCDHLGVDAILVFAVTEYDAYTPVVGLAAQLYGPIRFAGGLDPVAASRMARPFPVADGYNRSRPVAQVQRVFNGNHEVVQREVKRYAFSRSADESPYGWKQYLVNQRAYLRYCCFTVARDLLSQRMRYEAEALAAAGE